MSLLGVRVEVPTNQPIVLLREERGARYLPIFIGAPEATAIAYALQGVETPRPMTHDLFTTVLDELGAVLEQVEITGLEDGTFFAEREGALFQQVLAPFLRQKNPVSRGKVEATLNELVGESRALRAALLRRVIDDLVGD